MLLLDITLIILHVEIEDHIRYQKRIFHCRNQPYERGFLTRVTFCHTTIYHVFTSLWLHTMFEKGRL